MTKVSLLTLGCKANQSESSVIEGTLRKYGISIVGLEDSPDYCIVNTCSVTSKSDCNSRQLIRRAAKAGSKVIVTGCYSQIRKDVVSSIPGVVTVVDIRKKHTIPDIVTGEETTPHYGYYSRSRPFLKVQDGCNFRCSYCSVPLARGRSMSIPLDEVIKNARQIEENGYNEIVLTGIHLGMYGHDLHHRSDVAELLRKMLGKTRIPRIRLSSLEVNEVTEEILELFADARLCNHLHIPLQSGSNKILEKMGRKYTKEQFISVIKKIAGMVPNVSIGTDIIVGFPGETEHDFEETGRLLRELPFTYLHVFPYSPRPDTAAYYFPDRPGKNIVEKRLEILALLNKQKKNEYLKGQTDRVLDIIVEEQDGKYITGTSRNYLKIRSASSYAEKGTIVNIGSLSVIDDLLCGDVVKQP